MEKSPEVLVSNIAAEMLSSLGSCQREGDERTEHTQVKVEKGNGELKGPLMNDARLERELEASGLWEGKKDLDKPGEFGWIREVVTHHADGHITATNYITPPHPVTKARRRIKTRKDTMKYLESVGNKELSFRNFNLSNRFLGLKHGYEVVRTSMSAGNDKRPQKGVRFAEYFKWLPIDPARGTLVDSGTRRVRDSSHNVLTQWKQFMNQHSG